MSVAFLSANWRYFAFGWTLTSLSTLGSGYFVGLFNPSLRAAFGLSHGALGLIFALTALVSGPPLMWAGRKIDEMDLRLYTALVCTSFAAGCFLLAGSSTVLGAAVGILLVRLVGDWLLTHTAVTSLARYFGDFRGRAIGFGAVGYAIGPTVFPVLAVALIETVGWRVAWGVLGVMFLCVIGPAVFLLLRGDRHRRFVRPSGARIECQGSRSRSWSRAEVLRDVRFYLVMPAAVCVPLVMSGLFFHQAALVEAKGWDLILFASFFAGYAASKVASMVLAGFVVDRIGAARLFPYYPLPLAIGILLLVLGDGPWAGAVYLAGAGMTSGIWYVVLGALWVELYGTAHLGAIRAMAQALMLLCVAISTFGTGWFLDLGVDITAIALGAAAYALASTLIALPLARWVPPR